MRRLHQTNTQRLSLRCSSLGSQSNLSANHTAEQAPLLWVFVAFGNLQQHFKPCHKSFSYRVHYGSVHIKAAEQQHFYAVRHILECMICLYTRATSLLSAPCSGHLPVRHGRQHVQCLLTTAFVSVQKACVAIDARTCGPVSSISTDCVQTIMHSPFV